MLSGAGGCFARGEEIAYSQPEFTTPKQRAQGSAPRALHPGSGEHRNPSDHPERLLRASSCKVRCSQTKNRCGKHGGTEVSLDPKSSGSSVCPASEEAGSQLALITPHQGTHSSPGKMLRTAWSSREKKNRKFAQEPNKSKRDISQMTTNAGDRLLEHGASAGPSFSISVSPIQAQCSAVYYKPWTDPDFPGNPSFLLPQC